MKRLRQRIRGWRPNSAHAIAILALFLALGGSAVALKGKGSVTADDIRRGAVRTKKIANFAATPFKTNLGRFSFTGPEVTTTSGPPVTLAGGPSVTVAVPKGAVVAVYAEVEARISNGAQLAQVHIHEASAFPNSPKMMDIGSTGFAVRRTRSGDSAGAGSNVNGGAIFIGGTPGKHTFTMRYSSSGGATAVFRNRKLWVTVLG
jgi:hypothetical protein